jgi:HK97 family phage portal protein
VFSITEGKGTSRPIAPGDLIHLKTPSHNGLWGDSPIVQARKAIATAIVMERHALNLFANGARPSGILSFPNKLGADTATRIKAAWQAAHGGSANSGGTAVLEEGGSWEALSLNSVDAQFLELRKFTINEIARVFRVPPHLLYEMGEAKWANVSQAADDFVRFSLLTWLRRWERQYLKLLTPEERSQYVIEFLVDDFLRADTTARATAYGALRSAGVMTANECRARENLPPLPGGDILENPNTSSPHAIPAATVAA